MLSLARLARGRVLADAARVLATRAGPLPSAARASSERASSDLAPSRARRVASSSSPSPASARTRPRPLDAVGAPRGVPETSSWSASASAASSVEDLRTDAASDDDHRVEHDLLGELRVPRGALYGVATARAMANYRITGIQLHHFPELIYGLAHVKKAAAIANAKLGLLDRNVADAIADACDALTHSTEHHKHFAVDVIQGGAGTSTNMCANEVIANLAGLTLGSQIGSYDKVHPNDHVNLCQSTNCAYPSAAKLAVVFKSRQFVASLEALIESLDVKGVKFTNVIKMGRTQLQDAVPMTLGQEFKSFASTLRADLEFARRNVDALYEMNLGGTAIGTKICAHAGFADTAVAELSVLTNLPLRSPADFIEASSSTSSFLLFSNILRRVAVKTSKICNDLRLLSSGPRCGFGEILLPPHAPGSSIMPGKINPVIPEVVNQVCFQVMGTDSVIATASEAAQLQLNVFEPVIVYNLLNNLELMRNGLDTLRLRCVDGVVANEERCADLVNNSIGIVTNLLPMLGYKNATKVAKEALETNVPVATIAARYLDQSVIEKALDPRNMT
jgi:aspartate ammonia-lyase